MNESQRKWCDFGGLHEDECHHCDSSARPAHAKTGHELWIQQLREQVTRATRAKEETLVRPHAPAAPSERRPTSTTQRWNPGNVQSQIGSHLTAISAMFDGLQEEAESRHNDREFPGGDAMVLLGPGADVEAFGYVQISALVGRIDERDVVVPEKYDLEPPLAFLASWEAVLREERNQPVWLAPTIDRSIKYIRDSIDWMFSQDDDGDLRFLAVDDLADGLRKVRRRMEDILKDGARADFTRVNCTAEVCETHPRLMKLWAAQVRWDRYRCPMCRTEYTPAQFEMAKSQAMFSRGADRFISQAEASQAAEVPLSTLSSWAARGNVRSQADELTGALRVWWPDVRERATERRERLKAAALRRPGPRANSAREA